MKKIILGYMAFAVVLTGCAEMETANYGNPGLLPDGVNKILYRMQPWLRHTDVDRIVHEYYPDAECNEGPWSGSSGYVWYKLTPRYRLTICEMWNKTRVVHPDMIFYVTDKETGDGIDIKIKTKLRSPVLEKLLESQTMSSPQDQDKPVEAESH